MVCANCAKFKLHLHSDNKRGLCSEWVETVFFSDSCSKYDRHINHAEHLPLSINGKTYPDFLALTKGISWSTGKPLPYMAICALALKYNIDVIHIEKLKKNKQFEQITLKL